MRMVFMGSADLSCRCLEAIVADGRHSVAAVVTQPDRPKGRHLAVSPCAAKAQALRTGIPVLTPERVNDPAAVAALRALAPDLIVVVAYGQILRNPILALPPKGCVNVHVSLLPRYRGAAPVQWAIARGETLTGVTLMYMNARMDAGDVIAQTPVPILCTDTAGTLQARLAEAGARLLVGTLDRIGDGTAPRTPQDEALATLAPKLRKTDGRIDWTRRAAEIRDHVRGFNPWPCCCCLLPDGAVLRVLAVEVEDAAPDAAPGTVVRTDADGPLIATGAGAVRLTDLQPEGGRRMSGAAYVRGHPLVAGTRLGATQ